MNAKENARETHLSRQWRKTPLAVFSICLAFTLQHSAAQACTAEASLRREPCRRQPEGRTSGCADLPTFEASYSPHCGEKIKALAALAGPDWRAVAEKNRTTGLERLSWSPLKDALVEKMQKYADKETGDVGGESLDEMPEIAEAALRSPSQEDCTAAASGV